MGAKVIENPNPNDPRTDGENYLLKIFKTSPRFEGWTVFEQPHINSMKPDFILTHPQKGILIIEVKDWFLEYDTYIDGGYVRGTDGNSHNKSPIKQVEYYKDNILHSQLVTIEKLSENFTKYSACIETIVYFHNSSRERAIKYCYSSNTINKVSTKIWDKKEIDYIVDINNELNDVEHTYALARNKSSFTKDNMLMRIVEELNIHLSHADYIIERKNPFILTNAQRKLADLSPGAIRRWSGVAGSGKSIILAEKASLAAKQDKNVLILCYNITLRHYLRDLCSQQFGRENINNERKKLKKNITINHFHDFLRLIAAEHQIDIDFNSSEKSYEDIIMTKLNEYFQKNRIESHLEFDYILIDEGQDFKGNWIRFLKQFYTQEGELFIVYDKAQNLYGNGVWIEDSEQIQNIGFKGRPGHLPHTIRLPDKIVHTIQSVRNELQIRGEEILPSEQVGNEQNDLLGKTYWCNCSPRNLSEKLNGIDNAFQYLKKNNNLEDITILTTNENTGVELVKYFKMNGLKVSHVYDLTREKNRKRRKKEKLKFHGGTGRLKVSSYQSFKGWQCPNILLILDSPTTKYIDEKITSNILSCKNVHDALFMSLSRVKGKAESGEYTFICLNYLQDYNRLNTLFD